MNEADSVRIRRSPCPQCGELVVWNNNPFRPFCSQRCKLLDLGAWIDERYTIPTEEAMEQNEFGGAASAADETDEF